MSSKITPVDYVEDGKILSEKSEITETTISEPEQKNEKEWENPIEFLMTCIS